MKADWAEMSERFGCPTWRSSLRPCLACASQPDPADTCKVRGLSLNSAVRHLSTDSEYADACDRRERHVRMDKALAARLRLVLRNDRRTGAAGGRCLQEDVPEHQLLKGDRLEPSRNLPDVGALEARCDEQPSVEATFWRRSAESLCTHRCPLWDARLGITPSATLAFDVLHILLLGTMLEYVKWTLWYLLDKAGWVAQERNRQEAFVVGVSQLRAEVFRWYEKTASQHPDLTRLTDLTPKMLGSVEHRQLKTKGAETYGLLLCAADLVNKHRNKLGSHAAEVEEAGRCLIRFVAICKQQRWLLKTDALQEPRGLKLRCSKLLISMRSGVVHGRTTTSNTR